MSTNYLYMKLMNSRAIRPRGAAPRLFLLTAGACLLIGSTLLLGPVRDRYGLSPANPAPSSPDDASEDAHDDPHLARRMLPSTIWPELAWMLSFPDSGANYIKELVTEGSKTTTATNYGNEIGSNWLTIPEIKYSDMGPFRVTNNYPFPPRYILTDTHCTDYCLGCGEAIGTKDMGSFLEGCGTGRNLLDNSEDQTIAYSYNHVQRAVHLVRDPFDNIVERFREKHRKTADFNYENSHEGFLEWCKDMDDAFSLLENRWTFRTLAAVSEQIPCYGLFYQYIQWHNHAFDVDESVSIPILVIHYNDFRDNIAGTVSKVFEFLDLPPVHVNSIPPFMWTGYSEYFTSEQRKAVSSFVKVLASQQTWDGLHKYLPIPDQEELYAPVGQALSSYYGSWPKVAWLLAFPNSGSFFTTQLTQTKSRTSTATNYGNEVNNYKDIPNYRCGQNGPFRASKRPLPTTYILTKTHCQGRCIACSPAEYITNPLEFRLGCSKSAQFLENGEVDKGSYEPRTARVEKLVHLIRDPFDNIVARFHFAYKLSRSTHQEDWNFSYDKEGFLNWCASMDQNPGFRREIDEYYPADLKNMIEDVPCHHEFFQYTQWHNNAFSTTDDMKRDELVIHYIDFSTDYYQTIERLFGFLDLPIVGRDLPFLHFHYPDYFTDIERLKISAFVKKIASGKTWLNIVKYMSSP